MRPSGINNTWKRGPRLSAVPDSWIRAIEAAIVVRGMVTVAKEIGVPTPRIAIVLERSTCSEPTMKRISDWILSMGSTLHQENDWTHEQKARLITMGYEKDGVNTKDALRRAITTVLMLVSSETDLRHSLQTLTASATGVRRRPASSAPRPKVQREDDEGGDLAVGGDFDKVIGSESDLAELMDEEGDDVGNS